MALDCFWALCAVWRRARPLADGSCPSHSQTTHSPLPSYSQVGTAALGAASSAAAADVTRVALRGTQSCLLGQVQDATFVLLPTALGLLSARLGTDAALILTASLQIAAAFAAAVSMRSARSGVAQAAGRAEYSV